jgi:hypothetical protein
VVFLLLIEYLNLLAEEAHEDMTWKPFRRSSSQHALGPATLSSRSRLILAFAQPQLASKPFQIFFASSIAMHPRAHFPQ